MADWRAHPQSFEAYLWIMRPKIIFKARVNMGGAAYPLASITYDGVTVGAFADLEMGQTLLIGSTEGAEDYGRTYVRGDFVHNVATSTTINIGYSSRGRRIGEVDLQDDAYITVLDLFEPWKRPSREGILPGSILKDYALGTPTHHIPVLHVGNTGGVGTMDFVTAGVLSEDFDNSGSYVTGVEPFDSKTWDIKDGSYVVGNSASEQITASFPPGYRWIKLDGQNDEIPNIMGLPRRFCVAALETEGVNAPLATAYQIRVSRAADGQTLSADVRERLDPADYPIGTVVILLVNEDFDGEAGPLDGCWKVKFAGYLNSLSSTVSANPLDTERGTTITALDVFGRMKQLRAFPSMLLRVASEAVSNELEDANLALYIWWTLVWHSSIPMLSDVFLNLAAGALFPFSVFQSPGGDFYTVCENLARAMAHHLTCDSRGQLKVVPDPLRLNQADRTNVIQAAIGEDDWTDIHRVNKTIPRIGVLRATLQYTSSTNAPDVTTAVPDVYVISPGLVEGQGASASANSFPQLTRTSIEARERHGHDYARQNAPEDDLQVQLAHGGDVGIEPADGAWVTLDASEETTGWMDSILDVQRCLPLRVDFVYDDDSGTMSQSVIVEKETVGTAAAIEPRPPAGAIVISTPRTQPVLAPVPPDPVPPWTGELPINGFILSATETKAEQIVSFNPATLSVTYSPRNTGLGGTNIWFRSNPFDYIEGYALQTTGLYRIDDQSVDGGWTLVADNAAMFGDAARRGYKLLMSHLVPGWMMALCGATGAGVSFDYGATWTQVGINGAAASWSTSVGRPADGGDVAICGHDANHLYSCVAAGNIWECDNYRSTDGGLTWALITSSPKQNNGGGSRSPQLLEIPYARLDGSANTDDASLELYGISCDGTQAAVVASFDRAASWVGFLMREGTSINASNYSPAHSFCGSSLTIFTHDASYQYFGARHDGNGAAPGILIHTEDNYGSFLPVLNLANGQFGNAMVNGWSMNPDVAVGWTRGYRYSMTFDGALTWFSPNMPSGWADGVGYVEFSLYPFQ